MGGIDWDAEKKKRASDSEFTDNYSEIHVKTERIVNAPNDDMTYPEGGQKAQIQSDGERGRLITQSHKELYRCDCGCVVDSILKTRKDESGKVFCERHANLFCRLCSRLIIPGQQVKINESYYHQRCAEKVIDSILDEALLNPHEMSPATIGELKALKKQLMTARLKKNWSKAKSKIKILFRKKYGVIKKK